MSFTCPLYSDKVRCFNQSECALYGNFIIILDVSSAEQLLFELLNLLRTFHVLKLTAKKRRLCGLSRPKKIKQNLLEPNGLMSR